MLISIYKETEEAPKISEKDPESMSRKELEEADKRRAEADEAGSCGAELRGSRPAA